MDGYGSAESGLGDGDDFSGYSDESSDKDSVRESEEDSEDNSEQDSEEDGEDADEEEEAIETSDEDTESSDDMEDESNGSLSGVLPSSQSPSLASETGSVVPSAGAVNNNSSQRSDSVRHQGGELPVHTQRQGHFQSPPPNDGAISPPRGSNSNRSARPASNMGNLPSIFESARRSRHGPNNMSSRPLHPSSPNSLDDSEMSDLAGFVDLTSPATLGRTESGSNVGPSTGPRGVKRRRSQDPPGASAKRQAGPSTSRKSTPLQNIEHVNLLNVDDDAGLSAILKHQQEEQVKAQQQDKDEFPRLSTLQCVICLEPPTNLTATVCGHLFCHTCLMEALISGEASKTSRCPVCRMKLRREKQGRDGGKGKDWQPLELKFLLKDPVKEKGKGKDTG